MLDQYLERATDRAAEVLAELLDGGASYDQAWELVVRP